MWDFMWLVSQLGNMASIKAVEFLINYDNIFKSLKVDFVG